MVGAWLKEIALCDFVDSGVRVRGGGLGGLDELDVLGLRFADHICRFGSRNAKHMGLRPQSARQGNDL